MRTRGAPRRRNPRRRRRCRVAHLRWVRLEIWHSGGRGGKPRRARRDGVQLEIKLFEMGHSGTFGAVRIWKHEGTRARRKMKRPKVGKFGEKSGTGFQ